MLGFFDYLFKILPIYLNIVLGFIAGAFVHIPREAIVRLMFFIINPIVIFNGVLRTELNVSLLLLPIVVWMMCSFLCLLFFKFSRKIWQDSTANIMAYSAGSGNTGYFGLPLALLLFNDQGEGAYILAMMGMTLYESTIGFYVAAKGLHSPRECIYRLARLPSLYALILALFMKMGGFVLPQFFIEFSQHVKGAYAVLGMMIIGIGIAGLYHFALDFKFIAMTLLAKFIAWPLLALLVIFLDSFVFHTLNRTVYDAIFLLSIVPLGVSSVVMASVLNIQPEKTSSAVLISTFFGTLWVPFMASFFFSA